METRRTLRDVIRDNFVTTLLVTLIVSPSSIILGYYINTRLRAPDIRVVSAEAVPGINIGIPSETVVAAIKANPDVVSDLRRDLVNLAVVRGIEVPDLWLDQGLRGEDLDSVYAAVYLCMKRYQDDYSFHRRIVPKRRQEPNSAPTAERGSDDFADPELQELDRKLSVIRPLFEELQKARSTYEGPRNGTIAFRLGLQNFGQSDGVVDANAALEFMDAQVPLFSESGFIVVKAHSYEEVWFVVDSTNAKVDCAKLEQLVRTHSQEKIHLELRFSGRTATWDLRLPP